MSCGSTTERSCTDNVKASYIHLRYRPLASSRINARYICHMPPLAIISLKDCARFRGVIDNIVIKLSTIIPGVCVPPGGRDWATRPKAHGERPIRTVTPFIGITWDGTAHIKTLCLSRCCTWHTGKKSQHARSHTDDCNKR